MFELLLIAIGLAMDCVAVSAARGVAMRGGVRLSEALKLGITFGGMQAGMAALGWAGGVGLTRVIEAWDHWIAFGLLLLIGGKMVVEGLKDEEDEGAEETSLALGQLLLLGVATSIDSAAVGVTLPLLGTPLMVSLLTIGIVSFALSVVAAFAAEKLAGRFAERLEVLGGLVLVGIGVKILIEHLL